MLGVRAINSAYAKAHVLRDLSFEVPRREVVAPLGRNGAGESITMKSMMQIVRTRSGRVSFQGQEIA